MDELNVIDRYSILSFSNKKTFSSLGLKNGKMKAIIFYFHCFRSTEDGFYEKMAEQLLEELHEEISLNLPLGFANGLCGIGWGISYLLQQGFIEGNADEILSEIDSCIISEIFQERITDLSLDSGLLGIANYISIRISSTWDNKDTCASLLLKEYLIYLIDHLERNLYNGYPASEEGWLEWLRNIRKTDFYKTKVDRLIRFLEIETDKL